MCPLSQSEKDKWSDIEHVSHLSISVTYSHFALTGKHILFPDSTSLSLLLHCVSV